MKATTLAAIALGIAAALASSFCALGVADVALPMAVRANLYLSGAAFTGGSLLFGGLGAVLATLDATLARAAR